MMRSLVVGAVACTVGLLSAPAATASGSAPPASGATRVAAPGFTCSSAVCVTSSADFASCLYRFATPDANFNNNFYRDQSQAGRGCGDPSHTVNDTVDSIANATGRTICMFVDAGGNGTGLRIAPGVLVYSVSSRFHNKFSSWYYC